MISLKNLIILTLFKIHRKYVIYRLHLIIYIREKVKPPSLVNEGGFISQRSRLQMLMKAASFFYMRFL